MYHPVDDKEHGDFNDFLCTLFHLTSNNINIISGQDVNVNGRMFSKLYIFVLAPYGIDNQKIKGRDLIRVLKYNKLKILNIFTLL